LTGGYDIEITGEQGHSGGATLSTGNNQGGGGGGAGAPGRRSDQNYIILQGNPGPAWGGEQAGGIGLRFDDFGSAATSLAGSDVGEPFTGQDKDGNSITVYYFAGGGAGGNNAKAGAPGGGGTGAGSNAAGNGLDSTGGGGGGGFSNRAAGDGGSGVCIVRYPV
jgi:hypothetical protein